MKRCIVLLILSSVLLGACGSSTEQVQSEPAQQSTQEQSEKENKTPVTESDFRSALAEAPDEQKLVLYRDFAANFRMNEDEYLDYAALCEQAGDTVTQRRALMTLYKLDPTEAHGELLSAMTLKIQATDDAHAEGLLMELADLIAECGAGDFSAESLRAVVDSEDWKRSFYIDNGVFTSNTEYIGDALSAEVASDQFQTVATIWSSDTKYACEISYEGVKVASVALTDGAPAGAYVYREWDADGADVVSVTGTVADGHLTGSFTIVTGAVSYAGTVDDAGKSTEEQIKNVNGTIYAYSDNKKQYLYADGDASDWVADLAQMGFWSF